MLSGTDKITLLFLILHMYIGLAYIQSIYKNILLKITTAFKHDSKKMKTRVVGVNSDMHKYLLSCNGRCPPRHQHKNLKNS